MSFNVFESVYPSVQHAHQASLDRRRKPVQQQKRHRKRQRNGQHGGK